MMENIEKDKILFVRASGDSPFYGIAKRGYTVIDPYKGYPLVLRLMREVAFRLLTMFSYIWYNKKVCEKKYETIIVFDSLITRQYLKWLIKKHPEARIIFTYENLVGRARHVLPDRIPSSVTVWTYDENDAEKYGLKLNKVCYLAPDAHFTKKTPDCDVLFVGRDKGRAEKLFELEEKLHKAGLTTDFHITVNGNHFCKKKDFYKPVLKYGDVIEKESKTRAILNYVYTAQRGISMRDVEAILNGVKLITNNEYIVSEKLYKKENIFVLGVDDIDTLSQFLDAPFATYDRDFYDYYSFENWLRTTLSV